ncbi:uncharacterized protein LOC135682994 [Rhopilema esculentum]|uniref:uncharacterized protein LOC135682994 n=1 Tax=Rhopilema esculentum TaxID=499914 RepID=UPI0031D3F0CE
MSLYCYKLLKLAYAITLLSVLFMCVSTNWGFKTGVDSVENLKADPDKNKVYSPTLNGSFVGRGIKFTARPSQLKIVNKTLHRASITPRNNIFGATNTSERLPGKNWTKQTGKEKIKKIEAIWTSTVDSKKHNSNESSTNSQNTVNSTQQPKITVEEPDCSKFVSKDANTTNQGDSFCYSPNDSLKCYQDPIFCETYHLSGKRELRWPAYGEYSHLSHEHWVKILQHGGVVFLYHPCANTSLVTKLRQLAESCLHRYVLTPYEKLTSSKPIALVSWGCFLLMNKVDFPTCKRWIKSHAYKGPASHIHKNGTYEHQLVRAAKVITDVKDTFLCPDEHEKASLQTTKSPVLTTARPKHHIGEEIIMKRLAKAKHKTQTHQRVLEPVAVDRKKAFTAFGSLVFLFILLLIFLLYTKLWTPNFGTRKRFRYEKLGDLESESEYYESQFSLLKSGQEFISSLKRSKKTQRRDAQCKVKLLAPIIEEDSDSDFG